MRRLWFLIIAILILAILPLFYANSTVDAQVIFVTRVPNTGYLPPPTPDAADVIVIPPPPQTLSPVDAILADPAINTPGPTPVPNLRVPPNFLQIGDTALVTTLELNVRTAPSLTAPIIGQLNQGEDVTILGLSGDLQWAFVDTRGKLFEEAWVSTLYIERLEDFQPFAPGLPDTGTTGFTLRALFTVNIRSAPTLFSDRVGILPENTTAAIVGRKSTYNWWKIRLDDGTVGWVAREYIYVVDPDAYQQAPILTE